MLHNSRRCYFYTYQYFSNHPLLPCLELMVAATLEQIFYVELPFCDNIRFDSSDIMNWKKSSPKKLKLHNGKSRQAMPTTCKQQNIANSV